MKTIAYIDGYNFYYGLLNNNCGYKWLDIYKLFAEKILKPQNPSNNLLLVKFYTADIQARFASRGDDTLRAQQTYHRALESPYTELVEIIKGTYTATKDTPMRYRQPPDKADRVTVSKPVLPPPSSAKIAAPLITGCLLVTLSHAPKTDQKAAYSHPWLPDERVRLIAHA